MRLYRICVVWISVFDMASTTSNKPSWPCCRYGICFTVIVLSILTLEGHPDLLCFKSATIRELAL